MLNQEVKAATLTPVASTSPSSWEKIGKDWQKDWQKDKKPLFDPNKDQKGPFTVAALVELKADKKPDSAEKKPEAAEKKPAKPEQQEAPAEKPKETRQGYLAVFGDADFAADEFFNQLGNADLFLNTVNFLASEEKQIIIRKRDQKAEPLSLPAWKIYLVFLVSVILLPLIMLTAGVAVYLRRRTLR
jgi:ABC-type uncharacterized transport system involved in gliding motility auxiliary subunit